MQDLGRAAVVAYTKEAMQHFTDPLGEGHGTIGGEAVVGEGQAIGVGPWK